MPHNFAGVAESADALDSGSSECKFMRVQVPSPAPNRVALAALFFGKIPGVKKTVVCNVFSEE